MIGRLASRRRALAAFWLTCCLPSTWGCGGGAAPPTAPTPPPIDLSRTDTPLELSMERYLLQLIGNDLSDDPALPACSPILVPRGGKFVTTFLWFRWEGDELVGRSRPPYAATLEIRLRRVSSSILGVAVAGTVTGAAPDEYDRIMGQRDTTFSAEGGVVLSGLVSPRIRDDAVGPTLSGWMRGPIAFRDAAAAVSLCTNAHYYLEPARPGGPHDDPTVPPYVPASSFEAIGAGAARNGAGVPTARPPGSADGRIHPDFIGSSAPGRSGIAVALRETVTNRWSVGNPNH